MTRPDPCRARFERDFTGGSLHRNASGEYVDVVTREAYRLWRKYSRYAKNGGNNG